LGNANPLRKHLHIQLKQKGKRRKINKVKDVGRVKKKKKRKEERKKNEPRRNHACSF
jgi:hypothetical protein